MILKYRDLTETHEPPTPRASQRKKPSTHSHFAVTTTSHTGPPASPSLYSKGGHSPKAQAAYGQCFKLSPLRFSAGLLPALGRSYGSFNSKTQLRTSVEPRGPHMPSRGWKWFEVRPGTGIPCPQLQRSRGAWRSRQVPGPLQGTEGVSDTKVLMGELAFSFPEKPPRHYIYYLQCSAHTSLFQQPPVFPGILHPQNLRTEVKS